MERINVNKLAIEATHGLQSFGLQDKHYIKGDNKGKRKPFWVIDGNAFEQLWNAVKPYVIKSVYKSGYYSDSMEREDLVQEIMNHLYWILFNYGPKPNGIPFSKQLPLSVDNILTNRYNKSQRNLNYLNYNAISLFTTVGNDSSTTTLVDTIECEQSSEVTELTAHLTEREREIVVYYLNSENKVETRTHFGISNNRLNKILQKCLN